MNFSGVLAHSFTEAGSLYSNGPSLEQSTYIMVSLLLLFLCC